ncbi:MULTISPECIES: ribonuclease Y [Congzhengia]|uniref:Ribonuclease Y n=1 Tax=Congzhengia minquanensis TaxID=2763657 RepID=A0A926HZZ6_9FIRM|nr:ribonuclease Y [Congzhengia minquanensis]MBC8541386.1 ribonuclease Y [Congzhengia minquanensis]
MNDLTLIIICAAALVLIIVAWVIAFKMGDASRKKKDEAEIGSAEAEAKRIIEAAKKEGESKKKEAILEAKEENHKSRQELDKEIKDRRNEISRQERRIQQKEENLDKKTDAIEKKEEALSKKDKDLDALREEIEKIKQKELNMLEQLAGLSKDEAKQYLLEKLENEVKHEAAIMVKDIEAQAKENAEKTAKNIIAGAIQKCAADHVAEATVSVVNLPNEEMKGRIIGREGRNIRTLETLTGIDLIIDDTPEAVILSGFDPVRREIARLSLEKLIVDGRIHPARIEEMYEKAKKEVETQIKQEGENATFETGVHGLHPEIIKLLGKLRFRTSYGQNVLKHSIEVSHIAGLIAGELGADITMAKRAGLLHDLGKAADHEMEGSHVTIGADLAKKYKESKDIVHAIMAHHGDIEATTVVAVIVQAADAISAARPGARRENIESYIKRLEKLEEIANSFEGVEKSFAIQAGREVRIMVSPENIKDDSITLIARDIVKKIENELEYPGQIKVNVIRETRAVEYAK